MHKVLIRPLRLEDAKISYKWRNDNEVWKLTGSKPNRIITEEIEKEWLSNKLKEINSYRFAIEVDNIYVGNIQLTDVVENESAEYHIFIGDKSYWGKGVANLATAQIIIFAKNVINLKSIYLSVNPENLSAIKVYEKNGFEKMNEKIEMHLKLSSTKTPTVSVFMMAYNHALFISEALEGVLMQKTNFDFDIVIGEDCSTDNTRQIILDYQKKYPGKFKLLLHEKNIGAMANQMAVFKACSGKYIAMCEGDDYWTDPYKLQKQVDFLEANEEYSICSHRYSKLINGSIEVENEFDTNYNFNLNNYFSKWVTQPLTVVFRHSAMDYDFINKLNPYIFDMTLFYSIIKKGNGVCLPDNMGVYRIHEGGIYSNRNNLKHAELYYNAFKHIFSFESSVLIKDVYAYNIQVFIKAYIANSNKLEIKFVMQLIKEFFQTSKSLRSRFILLRKIASSIKRRCSNNTLII